MVNPARAAQVAAAIERGAERRIARVLWRRGWRVRLLGFTSYGVSGSGGPENLPAADGWVRLIGRALLTHAPGPEAELVRGWRRFMTLPLPDVPVEVRVGEVRLTVRSGQSGFIDVRLPTTLPPGWHEVSLACPHGQDASARVRMVGRDESEGLVSDIDDTVLVTALPRPVRAFWNTFVRHESSRRPVPGMPELFDHLRSGGAEPFTAYVSTGPWNVAPSLERFLRRHGYPAGPLLMTDWGPGDDRWFRSGRQHKHDSLRRLLSDLPQLTWTLLGDDGQHDPALYDDLVQEHPDRVRLVLIRELSPGEQVLTHGSPMAREPGPAGAATAPTAERPLGRQVPVLRGPDGSALCRAVRDHRSS